MEIFAIDVDIYRNAKIDSNVTLLIGLLPSKRQINKRYSNLGSPILLWFLLSYATIVIIACNSILLFFIQLFILFNYLFYSRTQDLGYFQKVHLHYDNVSIKILQHSGCFHSNSIKYYSRGCCHCWGLDKNRNTTNWTEGWVTDSGRAGAKT